MRELFDNIAPQLHSLSGVARLTVMVCTFAALTAVAINFQLAKADHSIHAKKRSVVETGSMLGFLLGFYLLVRFHIGAHTIKSVYAPSLVIGMGLLIAGTIVNIMGRLALGNNWGNQVIIYQDHTMITGGAYRLVRHPLYASLIWMFIGAALVFQNWAALLATLAVFVPAMYYRGHQEETALLKQFPAYAEYQRKTGMLLPFI